MHTDNYESLLLEPGFKNHWAWDEGIKKKKKKKKKKKNGMNNC